MLIAYVGLLAYVYLLLKCMYICIVCCVWTSVQHRHIPAFAPYAECLSIAVHEHMTGPQEAPGLSYYRNSTFHCAGFIGSVDQLQHVRCVSLSLTMLH